MIGPPMAPPAPHGPAPSLVAAPAGTSPMSRLIPPHGGELCELLVGAAEAARIKAESSAYPSIELDAAQLCDLELLLNGAFSPLRGFLGRVDYGSVLDRWRLADGTVWPMPIVLAVPPRQAERLRPGQHLALRDPEGFMLARMQARDIWAPDLELEAHAVFGTLDRAHPGVGRLLSAKDAVYVGGPVQGLELPRHYDFKALRHTPAELRGRFAGLGWERIVAFHTRCPMHRAQRELTVRAAAEVEGHLLLHPVAGRGGTADAGHYARLRCYQAVAAHYPAGLMMLSLVNLAMRMAGPREALWHALIRKNYGCTHFLVGRDHAGARNGCTGEPEYAPGAAQETVARAQDEIGIRMLPCPELAYLPAQARYVALHEVPAGERTLDLPRAEARRRLREGLEIPDWFSYPDVMAELRGLYPPKPLRGIALFFTGLSGAGKSSVARVLQGRFLERGGRPVTLLDGDIVRKHLSSELGFSREHRDLNILRIGFVANEIAKNKGVAICAAIAPYAEARRRVRELISAHGDFIEIYVSTPLAVCEQRDRKGLYAKARAGLIQGFTGISDAYEPPVKPEIVLDTSDLSPEEAAQEIWLYLERQGYFG